MKKVQRLLSILIAGMAVIALCFLPTAQTDAITDSVALTITPSKLTANIDREFTVTVSASRIENAAGLTFVLKFDNTKVEYVSGTVKDLFADFVAVNKASNPGLSKFQSSASDTSAMNGYLGFYFLNTAVTGGSTVNADTPLLSATFRVIGAGGTAFSIDQTVESVTCAQAAVVENDTPALVPVSASSATVALTDNGDINGLGGAIAVSIAGIPSEVSIPVTGNVLTAQVSGVPANAGTLVYQWYRDNDPILNAIKTTYTVAADDIGRAFTVKAYSEEYSGILSVTTAKAVALRELVKSVTVEKHDPLANTNLVIGQNENLQLDAKVLDATATNRAVTWQSSNTAVATADQNGLVTAKATGTATITATARDGSGRRGSMTVSVVVPVTGITINNAPTELLSGKSVTLTATSLPMNATKKTVTWTLAEADSAYATINAATGLLQAKTGIEVRHTLTVTATAQDGFGITAVKEIDVVPVPISVTLSQVIGEETTALPAGAALPIDLGLTDKTLTLTAAVNPAPASQSVNWSSSNINVATVSNGLVTGLRPGTAVITARTADGTKYASITVNVGYTVHSLEIVGPSVAPVVASGRSIALTVQFEPAAPTVRTVKWEVVSGGDNVTVSTAGVVTGKTVTSPQDAVVRATATDGSGAYDEIAVTVRPAATMVNIFYLDISMNGLTLNLDLASSQELQLISGVLPVNAGQDVKWTTSPAGIITLDTETEPGVVKVKGLKPGVATITATTTDGTLKTAFVRINVTNLVSEITISGPQTVAVGRAITLSAAVKAGTGAASNPRVTWSVQNGSETYVAVNAYTGLVTGKAPTKAGEPAQIQATATDGSGIVGIYEVTVKPAATSISIQKDGTDIPGQALGYEYNPIDDLFEIDLNAVVNPIDAGQTVTWRSSDLSVATPAGDGSGKFTIHTNVKRTAVITATTTDGTVRVATLRINITTLVQNVTITANAGLEVAVGRSLALSASATPITAANRAVQWTSSNTAVATVSYGTVTGKGVGTAVITATAADGSGKYASVEIKVNPLGTSVVLQKEGMDITGQTLGYAYNSAGGGETLDLSAVVGPIGAGQAVTWYTSNANIAAKADEFGQFTIKTGTRGMAVITATAKDGSNRSATVRINVADLVQSVEISGPSEVAVFRSIRLTAAVAGPTTANKTVVWTSSDTTVAAVSYGTVTGRKAGSATITATAADGSGMSATLNIEVKATAVTSVTIQKSGETVTNQLFGLDLAGVNTIDFDAITAPDGASSNIEWISSAPTIATVDKDGVVTGLRNGMATITARAADGSGRAAAVRVNVVYLAKNVTISLPATGNTVTAGLSIRLTAQTDAGATNKSVVWSSSDTDVATVVGGTVTARAMLKDTPVTITATAADGGGAKAEVTIIVKPVIIPVSIVEHKLDATKEPVTGRTLSFDLGKAGSQLQLGAETMAGEPLPVNWTISPIGIVTVNADGLIERAVDPVTGNPTNKTGIVTVTATTTDGARKTGFVRISVATLAKTITVSPVTVEIAVGRSIRLTAATDAAATNKALLWSSSDTKIAMVSYGTVTGRAAGTAYITVKSADGGAEVQVPVTVKPAATSVVIQKNGAAIPGQALGYEYNPIDDLFEIDLNAVVNPIDAGQTVTWRSSDLSVATPDADVSGKFTIHTNVKRTAIITATTTDGTLRTATLRINITTLVKDVSITANAGLEVAVGRSVALSAAATPTTAANRAVQWTSSDTTIATVSYGTVTGRGIGTAVITATAADGSGKYASVEIKVNPLATSVVLQKDSTNITGQTLGYPYLLGGGTVTLDLSAAVNPIGAGQAVTWYTSNANVAAKADENGQFTIKTGTRGMAVITATAKDGSGRSAMVRINVADLVQTVELSGPTEVALNRSIRLTAVVTGPATANKAVVWTSSDTAVATVSGGMVTGRKAGSATITATAADGSGMSDSITITVKAVAVTSVIIQKGGETITNQSFSLDLAGVNTIDFDAITGPDGASPNVEWISSAPTIATVDQDGVVMGLRNGMVTVTARAADGSGRTVYVRVNCTTLVHEIELTGPNSSDGTGTVTGGIAYQLTPVVTAGAFTPVNKNVKWSIQNGSLAASVNTVGLVTTRNVMKPITITIVAAAADGSGVTGSFVLTITPPVS